MSTAAQDLTDQIAHIDALLVAYRAAELAIVTGGAQKEYKLDTGQQTIAVERQDLTQMRATIESLMNQKQILCQRQGTARGVVTTRGAW